MSNKSRYLLSYWGVAELGDPKEFVGLSMMIGSWQTEETKGAILALAPGVGASNGACHVVLSMASSGVRRGNASRSVGRLASVVFQDETACHLRETTVGSQ